MSSAQGDKTCLGPHVFRRQAILAGRAERSESLHDGFETDVLGQAHSTQALDVDFVRPPFPRRPRRRACASCFLPRPRIFVPPYKGTDREETFARALLPQETQSCLSKLYGAQLRGWSKVVTAVRSCSSGQTELLVSLGQTFACITANHVSLVRDFRRDQVLDLFGAFWRACQRVRGGGSRSVFGIERLRFRLGLGLE